MDQKRKRRGTGISQKVWIVLAVLIVLIVIVIRLLQGHVSEQYGQQNDQEVQSAVPAVKSICGIIPTEKMTMDISVDELDILQISLGQEAVITLDAMEGQEFTGVVTGIDQTGTNDGGSTKYTVELTMDREENMLAGMNAVVDFSLETAEQVLAVPEEALVEDGTKVYVYTAYDEENDTLLSPVEVITGVSDGKNVEICQGLEEGDSYSYKYADTVTYSAP